VHPFLLVQTKNPRIFVGLFFRNANAMTPVLRYNDDGQTSTLSFITIGGQLEVYIFGQGTAHSVIQSYQQFVGLSKLPPFWALGWQEASIDTSIGKTAQESVVGTAKKYLDQGYPLDAVYVPINSWDAQQDFTLDKTQYPNPIGMTNAVNANNQRLVAYLDAAVNVQNRASNPVYAAGKNVDAFVKSTINQPTDGYLMNKKLGKNVVYVDWLNGQASDFWSRQVGNYQKALNFDGLWTTMNEPYGDVAGELSSSQLLTNEHLLESIAVQGGEETPYDQSWFYSFWPLNKISTYFLPFIPELKTVGNYDANTLSLNGTHLGNA
jgi:alpha-glucosidase